MDKAIAVATLQEYREGIQGFYDKASPTQEFYRWRENVLIFLKHIFGTASNEHREFEAIRFEVSPLRIGAVEEIIRQSVSPLAEIRGEYAHYFQEGLHQADETLLAIIIGLRSKLK